MTDYAYTTVPAKIKPLMEKIRLVGVPPKANIQWLKSIGFTSSNDTTLPGILKAIGLADPSSGAPTASWTQYRGAHHRKVLGEAIRTGYGQLFNVYPDAHRATNRDLEHVFSQSSNAGKSVIDKTVATFKALCECAEFSESTTVTIPSGVVQPPAAEMPSPNARLNSPINHSPSVHIDIQIHISPEATVNQIEQIFKSMATHLYRSRASE